MQWHSHWGGKGGRVPPLTVKKLPKIRKNKEKSGKTRKNQEERAKIRKKEEKSGRKGKNQEVSFTLPLLTHRAGYATDIMLTLTECDSPVRIPRCANLRHCPKANLPYHYRPLPFLLAKVFGCNCL